MHQKLARRGSSFRKSKKKPPIRDENDELGFWAGEFDVEPILRKVRENTSLPEEVGPQRDHYREFDDDLRKRASYATRDVNDIESEMLESIWTKIEGKKHGPKQKMLLQKFLGELTYGSESREKFVQGLVVHDHLRNQHVKEKSTIQGLIGDVLRAQLEKARKAQEESGGGAAAATEYERIATLQR